MSVDRYTKIVLTVIAVSLTVIALDRVTDRATAQGGPTRVVICDPGSHGCAYVDGGALKVSQ